MSDKGDESTTRHKGREGTARHKRVRGTAEMGAMRRCLFPALLLLPELVPAA